MCHEHPRSGSMERARAAAGTHSSSVSRAYTAIREYTGIRYSGIILEFYNGIFLEFDISALARYTRVYCEAVHFQLIIPHIP
jgi:hypothetical protein